MAGAKVRGITIDLGVDASGVASGLKSVNSSINSTAKELKDIDRLLKLDPSNVTLLAQKHEALQRQVTQTRDKLNLLKQAEEELKKQMVDGGTEEQQKQLAALQREIISTERSLDNYESQLNDTESETKDLAKAEQQAEQATEKMKGGFSVLKGALANLAADGIRKAVDGFKELMTAGPAFADEILTLSSTTSLTTDTLQELSYMSGLVDVDVSTVAGSLKKLTKNMDSARNGTGSAADAFSTLGVSVTDINGNLRDNEDVFYDTIDALGKVENETERDALAMNIFGKSATDLNPMIEAGSDKLRGFAQEAHDMGYVLDGDALEALGRVQDEFDRFGKQMEGVKNQIAAGVAPAIERGMKKLSDVIRKIDWEKVGRQMGDAFNKLIDALEWIVDHGALVKSLLTGIVTAMAASKVASFVSTIVSMASALKTATVAQEGMNVAANANPYVALATAFVAVTAAVITWGKSLSDAYWAESELGQETARLDEILERNAENTRKVTEAYESMESARTESINASEAEATHLKTLTDELGTLVDANGNVADADKARAELILGQLNGALGTEYTMNDLLNGQYQSMEESVYNLIEAKRMEAILAAQETAYSEAIIGRSNAEAALSQIVMDQADLQNKRAQAEAELDALQEGNFWKMDARTKGEIDRLQQKIDKYDEDAKALESDYQYQADAVNRYTYDMQQYENNMVAAHDGNYDQISTKSYDTAVKMGEDVTNYAKTVGTQTQLANNAWITSLAQMLSEATGADVEFQDAGNGMMQAYANGEKYGQPLTISQMAQMNAKMNAEAVKSRGMMENAGRNIPSGVSTGIYANAAIATGAAASLAQQVSASFNRNLSIKSPSRVFAESGKYIVEGVAQGIDRNEGIAVDAVEGLGNSIQSAFNPSLNGTYSAMVNGGGIASVGSAQTSEAGILNLLSRYLPELANRDVTLDGDTLVGKLAPKYNKQFSRLDTLSVRGV